MKKYLLIAPILFLGLLACAPISEEQCQAGDWYALGVRDGARGYSESRVQKYGEECAKIGIRVDQKKWFEGREEGLKQYCTIQNAEYIGRRGSNMRPVCPNATALAPAWRHGLEYYKLTQELEELQDERDELRDVLASMTGAKLTKEQQRLARRYIYRLRNIEDDIDDTRRDIRYFRPYSG